MKQYCIDTLHITIHEHFGWGVDRIDKLTELWQENMDKYQDAINPDNKDKTNEADCWQERMDREFTKILRGKRPLKPFEERYPWMDKIKY